MKHETGQRLDRHFGALASIAAATGLGGVALHVDAAIVYSGPVNIPIPSTALGVYLDVVTGAHSPNVADVPNWDVNLFGDDALYDGLYGWESPSGRFSDTWVSAGGNLANLSPGTLVNASASFASNTPFASTAGPPGQASILNGNNLYGFQLWDEADNQVHYGWIRVAVSETFSAQPRTIIDYAYEGAAGVGIEAGATASGGATGACCFGNGPCTTQTASGCAGAGGTYAGDNVACAAANCAPRWACCRSDGTCADLTVAACTTAGGIWASGIACASYSCNSAWDERGDAGSLPGTAQVPMGVGGLTLVRGSLPLGGDVDMYLIHVCNPAAFSASTVGSGVSDTVLCLFSSDGRGVTYDDDTSTNYQSVITGQYIPAPGNYYLGVSTYPGGPTSLGQLIWNTQPYYPERQPDGPGAAGVVDGWPGGNDSGDYTIALNGACYADISTTGACCGADGSCSVGSRVACIATGGTYAGDSVSCVSANCPQPGACCIPGGCTMLTHSACLTTHGAFSGEAVTCASANCPRVYFLDDGSAETALGSSGGGVAFANQFTAIAGSNQITDIRIAFGSPASLDGTAVTAYLWSDPDQNGNPSDAQVLASATGVIAGAVDSFPDNSPTFVTFAIPQTTIPVGQKFFVGFVVQNSAGGTYPAALDGSGIPNPNGDSWYGYAPGTFDPNAWTNVADLEFALGRADYYLIRADGTSAGAACYANCDGSTTPPVLNVTDFTCFLQKFAIGDSYANCDGSTTPPVLNVTDFTCFLQKFAQGCH